MADRLSRQSALAALRAGAIIESESGSGTGKTETQTPENKAMERGGNSDAGTGTETGTRSAKSPVTAFAARTAEDYKGVEGTKPVMGTHPKTGEPVEVDYSQPGASPEAPFGLLPDGSPRVRRSNKAGRKTSAHGQSAIKNDASVSIVADAILFAHTMIAGMTQHAHWQMSQDEAKSYANALTDLQEAYGVDLTPKQAAWAKVATVIGVPTAMRAYASMTYRRPMKRVDTPKQDSQPKEQKQAAPSPPPKQNFKGPQTPSEMFALSGGNFLDGLTPGAE